LRYVQLTDFEGFALHHKGSIPQPNTHNYITKTKNQQNILFIGKKSFLSLITLQHVSVQISNYQGFSISIMRSV